MTRIQTVNANRLMCLWCPWPQLHATLLGSLRKTVEGRCATVAPQATPAVSSPIAAAPSLASALGAPHDTQPGLPPRRPWAQKLSPVEALGSGVQVRLVAVRTSTRCFAILHALHQHVLVLPGSHGTFREIGRARTTGLTIEVGMDLTLAGLPVLNLSPM